jgi:hypothetical protein
VVSGENCRLDLQKWSVICLVECLGVGEQLVFRTICRVEYRLKPRDNQHCLNWQTPAQNKDDQANERLRTMPQSPRPDSLLSSPRRK